MRLDLGAGTGNDWVEGGNKPADGGEDCNNEQGTEGVECDMAEEGDSCTGSCRMKLKWRGLGGLPGPLLSGTCTGAGVRTGVDACTGTDEPAGAGALTRGGTHTGAEALTGSDTFSGALSIGLPGANNGGMFSGADGTCSSITFRGTLSVTCVYVVIGKVYWRRNLLFRLDMRPEPSIFILY